MGQKISIAGVVSTYSLAYTNSSGASSGGVLSPNGDIYFVPFGGDRGQKINSSGIISTYSLIHTTILGVSSGGILTPNGDIYFIPLNGTVGQKISTTAALPFDIGTCCSSFLNKF